MAVAFTRMDHTLQIGELSANMRKAVHTLYYLASTLASHAFLHDMTLQAKGLLHRVSLNIGKP